MCHTRSMQGSLLEEIERPVTPEAGSRLAYRAPCLPGWEDMWNTGASSGAHTFGAVPYVTSSAQPYANWPQDGEAYPYQLFARQSMWSDDWEAPSARRLAGEQDPKASYQPGQLLAKSAQLDIPADYQGCVYWQPGSSQAAAPTPPCTGVDAEARSECSTVDTAEGMASARVQTYGVSEPPRPQEGGILSLLGTPSIPSLGSAGHLRGACKPCAFVFKGGCGNGVECKFCHLCESGEKKRRKKESKERRKVIAAMRR